MNTGHLKEILQALKENLGKVKLKYFDDLGGFQFLHYKITISSI